jgi:CMP-N,N'-diacetyllegionaminic acid synthase
MSLLITVCARGGSKGVPGKNIASIYGKPLMAYTVAHALQYAKTADADIALSTDDDAIRSVAAEHGLVSDYIRPAELATDACGKLPVIRDLLLHEEKERGKTYEYVLDLDVTAPLRTMDDIDAAFELLKKNPTALNLFSVSFPVHNPYFDMVEEGKDGFWHLVKKPNTPMLSRQQGPRVYELNNSFYFYRRSFFEPKDPKLVEKTLVYVMDHVCLSAFRG